MDRLRRLFRSPWCNLAMIVFFTIYAVFAYRAQQMIWLAIDVFYIGYNVTLLLVRLRRK